MSNEHENREFTIRDALGRETAVTVEFEGKSETGKGTYWSLVFQPQSYGHLQLVLRHVLPGDVSIWQDVRIDGYGQGPVRVFWREEEDES